MLETLVALMIFQPVRDLAFTPADEGLVYEDVRIAAADGVRIHGWYVPSEHARGVGPRDPAPVVLFFHGNAGNIGDRAWNVRLLHDLGLAVLIIDYRGYGQSEGEPSEQGVYLDADAAWQWLTEVRGVDAEHIIVFGRSLGGAVAVDLARRVRPGRLILESTFTSVRDMAAEVLPVVPRFLVPDVFDSVAKAPALETPTLVVHGTDDEVVPYALGERLFEAIGAPKRFVAIPGAGHNDLVAVAGRRYPQILSEFIEEP